MTTILAKTRRIPKSNSVKNADTRNDSVKNITSNENNEQIHKVTFMQFSFAKRQPTSWCNAVTRTGSQRLKMFFGTFWKCLEFEANGCKTKNVFRFQFYRIIFGSSDPSTSRGRPIVDGYLSDDSKMHRTKFQYLHRIRLVNPSHLFSSKFLSFLSTFRHLKTYMLSLGNIETAPLTPQMEGKDWIDALALYMPPLRCPTDPALLLPRTRGYGVTAPRGIDSEGFGVGLICRADGPRMSSVVIRNIDNKPAPRSRQAPLLWGFGVL